MDAGRAALMFTSDDVQPEKSASSSLVKRKRELREVVKDVIRSPKDIDFDRRQACGCPSNCCIALPWETQAAIRNYLYGISQQDESAWRKQHLRQLLLKEDLGSRRARITFQGMSLYLKGFAIFVGGQNYLRTCYRDLASIAEATNFDGISTEDRRQFSELLRAQSHRQLSLSSITSKN